MIFGCVRGGVMRGRRRGERAELTLGVKELRRWGGLGATKDGRDELETLGNGGEGEKEYELELFRA